MLSLAALLVILLIGNPLVWLKFPDKKLVQTIPVMRTKNGYYVIMVQADAWPEFTSQLERGMKEFGIDGLEFQEMLYTVTVTHD